MKKKIELTHILCRYETRARRERRTSAKEFGREPRIHFRHFLGSARPEALCLLTIFPSARATLFYCSSDGVRECIWRVIEKLRERFPALRTWRAFLSFSPLPKSKHSVRSRKWVFPQSARSANALRSSLSIAGRADSVLADDIPLRRKRTASNRFRSLCGEKVSPHRASKSEQLKDTSVSLSPPLSGSLEEPFDFCNFARRTGKLD